MKRPHIKFSLISLFILLFVLSTIIFNGHSVQATTLPASLTTPLINVTSSQRAVWAQMKADYDANPTSPATVGGQLYAAYQKNALCGCRYADDGFMATMMYQITGDPQYVTAAWNVISNGFLSMSDSVAKGDFARENFIENVTIFDWLYPVLTPTQRQQLFDKINVMATNEMTNVYNVTNPIRTNDSDQTIGDYYGFAMWYLITKDFNPTIVNIWANPEIGGFQSTGTNLTTLRNAITYYATQLGTGGEWMESSMYNIGTEDLILMGDQGMKSLTGTDYYPEVTALIPLFAQRQLSVTTDDLAQSMQWGDNQYPRGEQYFYIERLNTMLAGLTKGTPVGMALQDLALDLIAQNPADHDGLDTALAGRYMYFFDPYAPRGDRTAGFFTQYAPGMGTEYYHDGRGPQDSLFFAQSPKTDVVDHTPFYLGDFQLYRNGEWAITHPIGYASASVSGHGGDNSMVIGAIPQTSYETYQFHQPLAQEFGNIASQPFAYMISAEGGQIAGSGTWNPPPTFLEEHSRSILYLPSSTKNVDTIVVYDRVNAKDPATLPGWSTSALFSKLTTDPALKEWYIHMPVIPTVNSSTITWSTPKNSEKVTMLLPVNHTATVGTDDPSNMNASEVKYLVSVSPSITKQWDTFLNVVQAGNSGVSTTNTLVKSSGGETEGVVVSRPNQNDFVALFNARPSGDLPQLNGKDNPYDSQVPSVLANDHLTNAGYSATFSVGTSQSEVLLADLDPTAGWSTSLDGGAVQNLAVDSQGLGKLTLSGTGSHSIVLTSAVNPNPVIIPAIPVVTLSANPSSGTAGVVNPTLTWNVTNSPSSCTASGDWSGTKPVFGSNVALGILSTVKTYTYTLTCTNASGASIPVSATVAVSAATTPTGASITVDANTRYQTMSGWEGTGQIGQDTTGYTAWQQPVLNLAANTLGLNRVRLEIKSDAEPVNDNNDPNVINPVGFNFSALDTTMNASVLPLRQLLAAKGEHLYVNLNFVAFRSTGVVQTDPAEYAEFMLATFQHMQSTYGFVPDAVEAILEPDNGTLWTNGTLVGQSIAAAGARLAAAGFHPDFIGPSTMSMANTVPYLKAMLAVPGVTTYLKEVSYHRYAGVSDTNLTAIHALASQYGLRTAMLEHIGSTADDLYSDLTLGGVSAWQQYTIAYPSTSDNGGQYYRIVNSVPTVPSRTPALRQYFEYVRFGAVRVGASSNSATFAPVAFVNTNGTYVVVNKATAAGSFTVSGLPGGTYGIFYTAGSQTNVSLSDVTVTSSGTLITQIPAAGVITVYEKSGGSSIPPPPTPLPVSTKFKIGDTVQATDGVAVRSTPSTSGTSLGTQSKGSQGTIVAGPVSADSYNWWQINYASGPDGWSVENYLTLATSTPPPPPPPPPPTASLSSLKISPSSAILNFGQSQQFTATATWSDGTVTAPLVTWASSCGTITTTGLYTAATTCSAGTISDGIRATYNGVTAHAQLTLQSAAVMPPASTPIPPPTQTSPAVSGAQPITWTNLVNTTASGNTLTKSSGTSAWDAGGTASQTISSGNGYIEFTAQDITERTVGLSENSTGTSIAGIDYNIYLTQWGTYYVRIHGVSATLLRPYSQDTYKAGDVFRVAYEGGAIKVYQNGILLGSFAENVQYPLYARAAIFTSGGTVQNASIGTSASTNTANVISALVSFPTNVIILALILLIFVILRTKRKA